MDDKPVIVERTFSAPVEIIWKAITDKDEMKKWYFDLKEFKPIVGFEFRFWGGPDDDNRYLHICKITEVIKGKKLSHSWRYDKYEGISYVTFELIPEGEKTKVRLTHSELETFPASNPHFARKNFQEGWTQIIGTSLKGYLES